MKRTKNLLALLLAALLAFGIGVPATAAGVNAPAEYAIPYGEDFTLQAQIPVPAGVNVSYQWYYYENNEIRRDIQGATGPTLSVAYGAPYYPSHNPYSPSLRFDRDYFVDAAFTGGDVDATVRGWAEVVMTMPFVAMQDSYSFPFGSDIVVDARRQLPPGVEVSYEWYVAGQKIAGESGPVLTLRPGDAGYPASEKPFLAGTWELTVYQDFTVKNGQGEVVETYPQYDSAQVTIEPERKPGFFEFLWYLFVTPLESAFYGTVAYGLISGGFLFLLAPVLFPYIYFVNFAAILQWGFGLL